MDARQETAGMMGATRGAAENVGSAAVDAGRGAISSAGVVAAGAAAAGLEAAKDTRESVSDQAGDVVESGASAFQAAGETVEDTAAGAAAAAGQMGEWSPDTAGEAGEAAAEPALEITEEVLTGNVDRADPEEMAKFKHPLEYVEGIGPQYAGQLKNAGVITCLDLLKAGSTRKGREQLAANSHISGNLILEWVNHVDLYRIKGVGQEYADLLEASGVDSVLELAQRKPANLANTMLTVNAQKNLVRKPPTLAQVEDWVIQAKRLPRVVSH
jgi:predicted flap endonuclease-1-like 5' DNA nuclease